MAPRAESAYERRIRRYLEAHPGATRQEARGHGREPGQPSEYRQRIRRYLQRHPGATRAEAAGQRGRTALVAYVRPGDLVLLADHIKNVERRPGGRWDRIEIMVVPDDPSRDTETFVVNNLTDRQLARLVRDLEDEDATLTPVPSLDVRRLPRQ